MLKLLLEMDKDHKLDINSQNSIGLTPLHIAVKELWRCQDVALFETLLRAGADVSFLTCAFFLSNFCLAR